MWKPRESLRSQSQVKKVFHEGELVDLWANKHREVTIGLVKVDVGEHDKRGPGGLD